uniref:Cytoskeleton-associated protein 5 n=1 Tax=Meloidogyne hapla TaxID=6305 RepID=A0A1I8BIT3_MELHA
MAKKNKTNKKKIKGAGNKDNLPHVLKQSNNNTSQPNKQQPPKIASDKLPLDKENIDGQSGQICTSEDKDLEVEVNVTTEASTPSPNFHPSPKLPLDKENIDGQIGQICTSEDKGLKVEVSVSTKDSTPSPNVNSSKSVSPKEESKKYYELKEKIDKMSENEKNFNTKIDKLLNQKGKAELKNFKESLNTDAICTIMVTANLDPAMFIEILTKLYDDNWTLQQKRNPKTGAIIHSPTNMLKRARDFLKDDDHNEAARNATNVLCEIAIKCVTPPNIAKALETATLLTNSKSLANE